MPYTPRFFASDKRYPTTNEPYKNEAGELLPCRRCGKNDPPLRGVATVVDKLVVEYQNIETIGGRKAIPHRMIVQSIGADGDPTPHVEHDVVIDARNYHRSCENTYQRGRRGSTRNQLKAEIEDLRSTLNSVLTQMRTMENTKSQTTSIPPPVIPRTTPRRSSGSVDPATGRYQRDPIYSHLQPLPPIPDFVRERMKDGVSDAAFARGQGWEVKPQARLRELLEQRNELCASVDARFASGNPLSTEELARLNVQLQAWADEETALKRELSHKGAPPSSPSEQDTGSKLDEG